MKPTGTDMSASAPQVALRRDAYRRLLDALRTQVYQLRQAFTTAALAREQLLLAEETQSQYEQTQRLTEIRVEGGVVR